MTILPWIPDLRRARRAAAPGDWSPADISADAWFDANDLGTLWTATDGTGPAGIDDGVARWDDQSGNGNHWLRATSSQRPLLKQDGNGDYFLEGDGVDDFMQMATATPFGSSIGSAVVAIGYREITRQASSLFSIGANFNGHLWYAHAPWSDGRTYFGVGTFSSPGRIDAAHPVATGNNLVATFISDNAAPAKSVRINGSVLVSNSSAVSVNPNVPPELFRAPLATSNFMRAAIYAVVIKIGTLDTDELINLEAWLERS